MAHPTPLDPDVFERLAQRLARPGRPGLAPAARRSLLGLLVFMTVWGFARSLS